MPRSRSVAAATLACLALCAVSATTAQAALRYGGCGPENPYAKCAALTVPLDRSGTVPGTLSLHVENWGDLTPTRVLLALAGGPGQSASDVFGEDYLGNLDGPQTFVTLDQRGTGLSGALRCPQLQRELGSAGQEGPAALACANRLGPARAFYTTRDSVEDIEALRLALGVPKLAFYGVSYGTKVALAYARAYPDHVERLLLDSIQEPEGPDPFYRDSFQATTRVLATECGSCRGISSDPGRDLTRLVARLRRAPLRGLVVDARGRKRHTTLNRLDLFELMAAGDTFPQIRAALPAAIRGAMIGDPAPLLRLAHADVNAAAARRAEQSDSAADFAAAICEEVPFPWDRTATPAERGRQARAAAAALPAAAFGPFDADTALGTQYMRLCRQWPTSPTAPALATGPYPNVPMLLMSGAEDLRTPLEEARRVDAALPHGQVLVVPHRGHGELGGLVPSCVKRAVRRFLHGQSVAARCTGVRPESSLVSLAPTRLAQVTPAPGAAPTKARRVLAAVGLTLEDVASHILLLPRAGGLRGGWYRSGGSKLVLHALQYVPGVSVSGVLASGARLGVVRVSGPGGGLLALSRSGLLSGGLGGQAVSGRVPRAVLSELALG